MYKINPDRNSPWNDLPELPIEKELYYSVEILEELVESKAALARLQGRSAAIPNQGILINTISLQEAKASSAIENIFTTDDELYRAYSTGKTDFVNGPVKEIIRYQEALWTGMKYIQENNLFDAAYCIKIYQKIKQTTDNLRPPFAQIVIRQGGSGINAGSIIYTPPRGKEIVEKKLNNLLNFMNDDEAFKVDPLLKMAIGHFQFEAIHPFRDGNGRTGRVFNIHYLTKKGLLDWPILFLSRYIIENKHEYYRRLSAVSQQGDWENWILYMLRAVRTTSAITYNKINDIISAKDAMLSVIEKDTDIMRPEQITQMIFIQPYTKVKHLTDKGIYAENTARNYLNRLSEMGILEKITIQGHHYYLNLELNRILSE
ncbi:MAG TPA: Fic/DOC family N-terminal domain-containing protein [Bacteroidales bacterium]|nr:Fic/DOC family N-terminal domain-containing protein [Bacteroidales bacterium]